MFVCIFLELGFQVAPNGALPWLGCSSELFIYYPKNQADTSRTRCVLARERLFSLSGWEQVKYTGCRGRGTGYAAECLQPSTTYWFDILLYSSANVYCSRLQLSPAVCTVTLASSDFHGPQTQNAPPGSSQRVQREGPHPLRARALLPPPRPPTAQHGATQRTYRAHCIGYGRPASTAHAQGEKR